MPMSPFGNLHGCECVLSLCSCFDRFHFVGQLLGIALRSRVHMHLSLASMVWKAMVGQALDTSDLEAVDETAVGLLRGAAQAWQRWHASGGKGKVPAELASLT